jgi:hypothetical protein
MCEEQGVEAYVDVTPLDLPLVGVQMALAEVKDSSVMA